MSAGSPAFPRRYTYQLSFTAEGPPGSTATARSEPLAIDALKMERLYAMPTDEGGVFGCVLILRAPGARDTKVGDGIHVVDNALAYLTATTVLKRGDVVEIDAELPTGGVLVFTIVGIGIGEQK